MGLKDIFNSIGSAWGSLTQPLSSYGPQQVAAPIKAVASTNPDNVIYEQASQVAKKKYGVTVPPYFLKSVRQQESSNIVDPNDYGRSFGLVNAAGENGAKLALGKDYLPDTSLSNSAQNSANYLASRAYLKNADGTIRVDVSTPENFSKWYVQRYVGLLPGQFRMINGQKVTYEQIKSLFEEKLKANQP
jgi:hypothetical protein